MQKQLTAQQQANQRQNAKRRDMPRIPTLVITEAESALLNEMAALYGSKKQAIIAGLQLLKQGISPMDKATIAASTNPPAAVIKPTEGGHQKDVQVISLRETSAYYFATVKRAFGDVEWKFSKKDMLLAGPQKNEFPRYQLVIVSQDDCSCNELGSECPACEAGE